MRLTHVISCWLMAFTASLCTFTADARIQSTTPLFAVNGKLKADNQPSFNDSRDSVSANGEIAAGEVRPGAMVPVAIHVKVKNTWHMWPVESQARSVAGAAVFEGAIFTTLTLQENSSAKTSPETSPKNSIAAMSTTTGVKLRGAQWPQPVGEQFNFGDGTQTLAVYEGQFVVFAAIQVGADVKNGPLPVTLILHFQSCNDTSCLAPAEIEIPITLQVNSAAAAVASTGEFKKFNPNQVVSDATEIEIENGVLFDFFGATFRIDPTGTGFFLLLLVAFLGGMLLNFTPCVLPIIPLKIMSLSQGAGNRGKCFLLGVVMSLGVIGFWLALGVLVGGASGFSAANQLFQYPAFTIGLGIFIAFMAIGMAGFFSVGLPAWVYAIEPKHDSFIGTFIFGMMTAVLSTPCTAPLMGAAAGWAASSGSASTVLIVFGSIGAGMATPYLFLSAFPNLVSRMPRSGAASDLVKQVMGILLLAAAIFFIGAGLNGLLPTPTHAHWWLIGATASMAGVWLAWRTWRIATKASFRLVFTTISVVIVALSVSVSMALGGAGTTEWIAYSSAALAEAKANRKTIVLDFTAEWCLNCKALESAVLNSDEVTEALAQKNVAPIKVDITSRKSDGWNVLHEYKRVSIPLLVVQDANGKIALISDAYTRAQVVQAIERASTTGAAP